MSKFKNMGLFSKVFISFMVIIILPTAMLCISLYNNISKQFEEEIEKNNYYNLQKLKSLIEQKFMDIDNTIIKETLDYGLSSGFSNNRNVLEDKKIYESLYNIVTTNDLIFSAYFYYNNTNKLISSDLSYIDLDNDKFYDTDIQNIYQGKTSSVIRTINKSGKNTNLLTFVKKVPLYGPSKQGAFFMNLDINKILDIIDGFKINEKVGFLLLSPEGDFISSGLSDNVCSSIIDNDMKTYNDSLQLNNEKYLIYHTTSDYNKWMYVSVIPYSYIRNKISFIKYSILFFSVIMCIISTIVALFITRRLIKPITGFIKFVQMNDKSQKSSEEKDEISYISSSYKILLDSKLNSDEVLEAYNYDIKVSFAYNFLSGYYKTYDEVYKNLGYFNLNFKKEIYICFVGEIDGFVDFIKEKDQDEYFLLKNSIIKAIDKVLSRYGESIVIERNTSRIYMVLNCGKDTLENKLLLIPEEVKNYVKKEYNCSLTIAIGKHEEDILQVYSSYESALNAIEYKLIFGKFSTIKCNDLIQYRNETDVALVKKASNFQNILKSGNRKEIKSFLDELFSNLADSFIYVQEIKSTINLISGEIDKYILDTDINKYMKHNISSYHEVNQKETLEEKKDSFIKIITSILDAEQLMGDRQNVQIKKAKEFIGNNIYNEVNLEMVANHVNLNPSYFSKLFKDTEGINFNLYVNFVRIEKSYEMLKNNKDMLISEISSKLKYSNTQYFIKKFKEQTGITPMEYRKMSEKDTK